MFEKSGKSGNGDLSILLSISNQKFKLKILIFKQKSYVKKIGFWKIRNITLHIELITIIESIIGKLLAWVLNYC